VKTINLPAGSRGIDTIQKLNAYHCMWLKENGFDFVIRYMVSLSVEERDIILAHGLALGLCTYAHSFDPQDELDAIKRLQVPTGTDIFLDVEDDKLDAAALTRRINLWAGRIKGAGCNPGEYVGSGNPHTSKELYALAVSRYWKACSRTVDVNGNEAAPVCGWVLIQLFPPNIKLECGLVVDIDTLQHDYRGRQVAFIGA